MRIKKLFCVLLFLLLIVPAADAARHSNSHSHQKKFEKFVDSINEAANQISWSGKHNFQDVEFIEDEMDGDETVYAWAWYADYYILIRSYEDKTWSKSYAAGFWTNSEELTFANGIKVGSSMKAVRSFFDKKEIFQISPNEYAVYWEAESDAPGSLVFSTENNRITAISYKGWHNMTAKMSRLFALYDNAMFANAAGDKVNVREDFPNGKVLFHVNRSKRDCLIVNAAHHGDKPENWYHVIGRVNDNYFKPVDNGYVARKFLKVRKLKISERNLYISQYLKDKK